jgi:hypothetical protein
MVYDRGRNRVVLFGGRDRFANALGDHWEFDGMEWRQILPPTLPPRRYSSMMAYDEHRQRVVLFRGVVTERDKVWEYDGIDWTVRQVPSPWVGGNLNTMVYDAHRRRMVMYLEMNREPKTWELFPVNPASYSESAVGCVPATGRLDVVGTSLPWIGDQLTLDLRGPVGCDAGWLLTGATDAVWNGSPLPLDLSGIGMVGCNLVVAPEFAQPVAMPTGWARVTLTIPSDPRLIGGALYQQALFTDPGRGPLPLTLSAGHVGVIGSR